MPQRPGVFDGQRRTLDARLADGHRSRFGHPATESVPRRRLDQEGAGWNAFNSNQLSKPQVKAQSTYYLPGKAGGHDFKPGFEMLQQTGIASASTASPVAYRISFPGTSAAPGNADRIQLRRRRRLQRFRQRLEDRREHPRSATTRSTGRIAGRRPIVFRSPPDCRIDYQDLSYLLDGHRQAGRFDGHYGGAGWRRRTNLSVETNVTGASLLTNTDLAPRIGVSYSLDRKGQSVPQGVLRTLLQQPRRQLLGRRTGRH